MGKYKDLMVNTGLFAFTQIATKLITFFLVPLYTAYMSTSDFGVTDMSSTVVSMVLPLATLSVSDAVLRFAIDDKANRDRYISLGLVVVLFSIAVVVALSPLLSLPFFGGLDRYRGLFIASYALNAIQFFFNMLARALNKVKVIPISSIITTVLTAGCAVVFIAHMGLGAPGFFYSLLIGNGGGVLCFFFIGGMFRHFSLRFEAGDMAFLKRMFIYSIPMVPNALFWWMSSSINRFFITGMIGVGASGLFAAAQKIPGLLNTAASIFQQAWQLSSFQQFRKTNIAKFFSTVFRIYHAGIAIVAAVIAMCSSWLASFLLQKEFYQAWTLIPIMVVAFYFNILNSYYGTVYTATLKTKSLFTTTVWGALCCVGVTWALIPSLGIAGACVGMVVSNLLVLVLRVFSSRSILQFEVQWPLVIMTAVFLVIQSVTIWLQIPYWNIVSIVITVMVCVLQVFSVARYISSFISRLAKSKASRVQR